MARIFLSYRRDDTAGHAGRIFDHLTDRFGTGRVFMDVEGIEAGEDFAKAIETNIAACDTVVAVIGKKWASTTESSGKRRIDDPGDYVRQEIETTLRLGVELVPVLVGGTEFPSRRDLPSQLEEMASRNALEIDDKAFLAGVERLIGVLEKTTAISAEKRRLEKGAKKKKPETEPKVHGDQWMRIRRLLLLYVPAHGATWILHLLFYYLLMCVVIVPLAMGLSEGIGTDLAVLGSLLMVLAILRAIAAVIEPDRTTSRVRRWWLLYKPPRKSTTILHLLFFLMLYGMAMVAVMLAVTRDVDAAQTLIVFTIVAFCVREIGAARDPLRAKNSEPNWFVRLLYLWRPRRNRTWIPRFLFYLSGFMFFVLLPGVFHVGNGEPSLGVAPEGRRVFTQALLYLAIALSARGWVKSTEALPSQTEDMPLQVRLRRMFCLYFPPEGAGWVPYLLFWGAVALFTTMLSGRASVLSHFGEGSVRTSLYSLALAGLLAVSAQRWARLYQGTVARQFHHAGGERFGQSGHSNALS